MTDEGKVERGIRFPSDVEVPDWAWYKYPMGDSDAEGVGWEGHIDLLHQKFGDGFSIEVELVDARTSDGILVASSIATISLDDGRTFQAIAGADETSNQVRDPEYVYQVSESRAIKRASKKALNLAPVGDDQPVEDEMTAQSGGTVRKTDDGEIEVDPPQRYKDDQDRSAGEGDFDF